MTQRPSRLRLAIVDDYPMVVAGVASLLAGSRIEVVRSEEAQAVLRDVDIVLYDTSVQIHEHVIAIENGVRESGAKVVIYSWNLHPQIVERALADGAHGYLSKVLTGPEVIAALDRVATGETVILPSYDEASRDGAGDWPGRVAGLSPREAEVLALVTQGLSDRGVADRVYLNAEAVTNLLDSVFQKIGVTSRRQAMTWGLANGFRPDILRSLDPALVAKTASL